MSGTPRSFHLDSFVPVMEPLCHIPAARNIIFHAHDAALDELIQLNGTVRIPGDREPPYLTIERVYNLKRRHLSRGMRAEQNPQLGRKIEVFLHFSAEWLVDLSEWIFKDNDGKEAPLSLEDKGACASHSLTRHLPGELRTSCYSQLSPIQEPYRPTTALFS